MDGATSSFVGQTGNLGALTQESFPGVSDSKAAACYAGDLGLILGSERSSAEGNDNPLQHSCLENPTDRGAWGATVHGVAESDMAK